MRRTAMAISAVLLLWGGSAGAQARAAPAGAAPRDVREVFLALPVPPAAPSRPLLSRVAPLLATRELREAAWERALAEEPSRAFLDTRNGYLTLCVLRVPGADCVTNLVMTYFVRANGERLVVVQVDDPMRMRTEDHFWTLAGGRFTPADPARFLPDLTYADFWGDQPLPRGMTPRFFREMGALTVAWPREGTTAWAYVQPLTEGMAEDDARVERLIELYERRRVSTLALVWDRRRGVFTKGRAMPYDPNGEEDHDHH